MWPSSRLLTLGWIILLQMLRHKGSIDCRDGLLQSFHEIRATKSRYTPPAPFTVPPCVKVISMEPVINMKDCCDPRNPHPPAYCLPVNASMIRQTAPPLRSTPPIPIIIRRVSTEANVSMDTRLVQQTRILVVRQRPPITQLVTTASATTQPSSCPLPPSRISFTGIFLLCCCILIT